MKYEEKSCTGSFSTSQGGHRLYGRPCLFGKLIRIDGFPFPRLRSEDMSRYSSSVKLAIPLFLRLFAITRLKVIHLKNEGVEITGGDSKATRDFQLLLPTELHLPNALKCLQQIAIADTTKFSKFRSWPK